MRTTDQYEGMIAETVAIKGHGGDYVNAYFARPTGEGPFPGMVLFHHRPGWDEWYKEATRRFAHHGYMAICPDLFSRFGSGAPDDVAAKANSQGGVPDESVVGDGQASLELLKGLPISNGKVGMMGTCSGGRHAYLAACRTPSTDAVVDCWGGRVVMAEEDLSEVWPVAPIDLTPDLACPVLGIFGNDDKNPPPAHVDQLEAALKEHGKDYDFHRYDGAGHGFFYYDKPSSYRAEQAVDGWTKIWDFLGRTLA